MKKGSFDFRSLVCLECGNIFTIPRKNVRTKSNGHIKDLWCPICKNVNKHYEVRDIDSFLYNLEYNNEIKQYVRDLINNGPGEDCERKDRIFKKILKR